MKVKNSLHAAAVMALVTAFPGVAAATGGSGSAFNWCSLIRPAGIATLSCLCLTFAAGVFRRKLGRRFLRIHLVLAAITVVLGLCHGLLVFVLFG